MIPGHITDSPAVLECLQFYLMTSILVDIRGLTQEGTIPMEQALTYQAVKFPEFSFDLLASGSPKSIFVPARLTLARKSRICTRLPRGSA